MRRSSACAVIQAAQAASTAAGTASSPAVPTSRSEQRRGDEEARAGGHPRGGAHGDGEGRRDVEPHMGELGERDAEVVDVPSRCTAAGRGRPGSARGGRPRSRTRRRSRSRSRRRSPGSPPGGAPSPSRRRSRPSSSRPRSGRRRAPRSRRNEPAVARTVCSRWPNAPERATTIPTTEPSAISGASGPSTAPKESVPIAASAIPGACDTGVAPPPMPSSGGRPPSPGSSRRARRTTHAPAGGSRSTRYHGGAEWPSALGRLSHSQCSRSCTTARKSAARNAAGIPITAPSATSLSYALPLRGSGWDTGGVTLVVGVDGRVAALFGLR